MTRAMKSICKPAGILYRIYNGVCMNVRILLRRRESFPTLPAGKIPAGAGKVIVNSAGPCIVSITEFV